MVLKTKSRTEEKGSCRKQKVMPRKKVVPEKTDVVKKKLDDNKTLRNVHFGVVVVELDGTD